MRHMSCVTCDMSVDGLLSTGPTPSSFYFYFKLGRLVGGSSVINGDTPSSFFFIHL